MWMMWVLGIALAMAADARAADEGPLIEGIVKPARQVVLKSSVVARVQRVSVEEAQRLEAGEPLVQLDAAVQEAVVRHAEAGKRQADLVLESVRKMESSRAATPLEVLRAQLDAEQAAATLALERERLSQYTLRAPFAGYVLRLQAREGSSVTEEDPVATFAELDALVAEFQLPADWYDAIAVGGRYSFEAGPPVNSTITGQCQTREPAIDPASQTFRCVFRIDNREAHLPAGFRVRWTGGRPNANASAQ